MQLMWKDLRADRSFDATPALASVYVSQLVYRRRLSNE
jgi:hypothetical protein